MYWALHDLSLTVQRKYTLICTSCLRIAFGRLSTLHSSPNLRQECWHLLSINIIQSVNPICACSRILKLQFYCWIPRGSYFSFTRIYKVFKIFCLFTHFFALCFSGFVGCASYYVPSLSSQRRLQKLRNFQVYSKRFHSPSLQTSNKKIIYYTSKKVLEKKSALPSDGKWSHKEWNLFVYIRCMKQAVQSVVLDTWCWWKKQKHEPAELPHCIPNPSLSLLPLRIMHNCTNLESLSLSTIRISVAFLRSSA